MVNIQFDQEEGILTISNTLNDIVSFYYSNGRSEKEYKSVMDKLIAFKEHEGKLRETIVRLEGQISILKECLQNRSK